MCGLNMWPAAVDLTLSRAFSRYSVIFASLSAALMFFISSLISVVITVKRVIEMLKKQLQALAIEENNNDDWKPAFHEE